jgi:hypothetical protein
MVAAGGTTINPTKPVEWWEQLSGGAEYVLKNVGEYRIFPLGMGEEEAAVSHLGQYFPSVYRVRSAGGHGSSLLMERYDTFLHEADPVQAIQVVGAKYLLTLGQMGADVAATYPLVFNNEDSFVYENQNPLPRAFVVHDAIQVKTPEEALGYLQGRNFDPGQTVILETDSAPVPDLLASQPSLATIVEEHPQRVRIQTNLLANGYLVLLDTYYPGWVATLDGRSVPIYRANAIGRAVFVPVGEHEIVFAYKPLTFRVGVWLALGMLITLVMVVLLTRLKRRSTHDSTPRSPAG